MNPGPVLVVMISKALIVQTKKFLVETEGKLWNYIVLIPNIHY